MPLPKLNDEGLIRKLSWSFAKTTKEPFKDLLQEASMAYLKALQTYNPEKGAASTHVWNCVRRHLSNYTFDLNRNPDFIKCVDMSEDWFTGTSDTMFFEKMTEDAFVVAKVVLSTPSDFVVRTKKEVEQLLKDIMEQEGWPRSKTMKAIQELQFVYSRNYNF